MNKKTVLLTLIVFAFGFCTLQAQSLSNLRTKLLDVTADTLTIDTLSVIENSVVILNGTDTISKETYQINPAAAQVVWITKPSDTRIRIVYRVYPYKFDQLVYNKKEPEIDSNLFLMQQNRRFSINEEEANILDVGEVDYSGSFSRGIAIGNRQDLVVNSSLNLQLSGMLANDVEILAALSDNNIPIQPEGNTQQIQEFDKIFIQLKKDRSTLIAGDYETNETGSYFMNFNKKLQGGKFTSGFSNKEKTINDDFGISAAVAKGIFVRNSFEGEEANQGPYKLQGNNGERFIVILAGSEQVFIDGKLIQRGEEDDYTIDYNLGEISFTPNQLITKDSRIIVEFEYSERYYLRSLLHVYDEVKYKKMTLNVNFYNEQDAKNQPLLDELTSTEKNVLSNLPSNTDLALVPGFRQAEFEVDKVFYKLADTTFGGIFYDSIFIYSSNPDSAMFLVNFTEVGIGNGSYNETNSIANGKIFEWVGPGNGNFIPFRSIVTPKLQQLITSRFTYKLNKRNVVGAEMAFSNFDRNTFSSIGKTQNKGMAFTTFFENDKVLSKSNEDWILKSALNYEYVNNRFNAIENYRNQEFQRDWSLEQVNASADENLYNAKFNLIRNKWGNFSWDASAFTKGSIYQGVKNDLGLSISKNGWLFKARENILIAKTTADNTTFSRPEIELARTFKKLSNWQLGAGFLEERKKITSINTDSLLQQSFAFDEFKVYLRSESNQPNTAYFEVKRRLDFGVKNNNLDKFSIGNTATATGTLNKWKAHSLRWNLTYRDLQIVDTSLTALQNEDHILGRVEYNNKAFKGLWKSNTSYELASGKEAVKEFVYQDVEAGQGNYVWIDYNGNKVQELDEFEISAFPDTANYLRLLVPSSDFIKAFQVQLNHSTTISPKAIWNKSDIGGLKKTIARFSDRFIARINRKTLNHDGVNPINPFQLNVADSSLVATQTNIQNTLYFNRLNPNFTVDYNISQLFNKSVLTTGNEQRNNASHGVKLKWQFLPSFKLDVEATMKFRRFNSEVFTNKNYHLDENEIEPKITYQPNTSFRTSVGYGYTEIKNMPSLGNQKMFKNEVAWELKYNVLAKSTVSTRLAINNVKFNGNTGNSVAYVILQGLLPGANYLWSVNLDKRVAKNIQLSILYDGRNVDAITTHTGQMQLRAIF